MVLGRSACHSFMNTGILVGFKLIHFLARITENAP